MVYCIMEIGKRDGEQERKKDEERNSKNDRGGTLPSQREGRVGKASGNTLEALPQGPDWLNLALELFWFYPS